MKFISSFTSSSIVFIFVCLLSFAIAASEAAADVTIGNGFTCSGSSIFKGTKEVKFTKAKSTLKKTIEKLKEKLADAPKKKKQKIKDQIAAAKALKRNFQDVSVEIWTPAKLILSLRS